MPVITALEAHERKKDRVKLFLDDAFAMDLSSLDAAQLRPGQLLTQAEVVALSEARASLKAFDRAVRYLSYRPRSVDETRRHLERNDFAGSLVTAAIERLIEHGYLDDLAFARFWLENRNRFKPMAPRALRYELLQKGIDDAIIDNVLSEIDAEESAYRAAHGRISRYRGMSRLVFRRKLSGMLRRRGFDSATIYAVVLRLQQELEESEDGYFDRDTDQPWRGSRADTT